MTGISAAPASAAITVRSLVDRPDEVTGYQVHLVYVVPTGSTDLNVDINGQIDSLVTEANSWLAAKLGHKFIFDTFQGATDVTFLQSQYRVSELCRSDCEALTKLKNEFIAQNTNFNDSKTLLFVLGENLDTESCGWANYASNVALIHNLTDTRSGCNWSTGKSKTGLTHPAASIIHELIHTFGIHHVCMDNSDLMIGTPECTIDDSTYGSVPITLDSKRSQYIGSDLAFGIDLLKMPIWSDGSGNAMYSQIKQISDTKHLSTLTGGTVYAVIGQKSDQFAWDWDKNFYPDGVGVKCQFTSGLVSIVGTQNKSSCVFDVPSTLRAGKPFTVTQGWAVGPWHGEATVTGTLARKDLSTNPCTKTTCFVGGTAIAAFSCWQSDVKSMTLQQLTNGKWADIQSGKTSTGDACSSDAKFTNYPDTTLNFSQTGTYIYRWFIPARPGFNSYTDKPFVVVVNDENSPEPSQDEVTSAQTQAYELGKAADAVKVSASVKKTITCIKGKLTMKITSTNPKCPSGYRLK